LLFRRSTRGATTPEEEEDGRDDLVPANRGDGKKDGGSDHSNNGAEDPPHGEEGTVWSSPGSAELTNFRLGRLETDVAGLRGDIRNVQDKVEGLRVEIKGDLIRLEDKMEGNFKGLRTEFKVDFTKLEDKMDGLAKKTKDFEANAYIGFVVLCLFFLGSPFYEKVLVNIIGNLP